MKTIADFPVGSYVRLTESGKEIVARHKERNTALYNNVDIHGVFKVVSHEVNHDNCVVVEIVAGAAEKDNRGRDWNICYLINAEPMQEITLDLNI